MALRRNSDKTRSSMQTAFIRFMLVVAFFIFWIGAVSVRLVHLQVNEHGKWKKEAASQRQDSVITKTLRGTIYDRNGAPLAMSIRVKSLSADPKMIEDIDTVSARLGKILGKKPAEIAAAIKSAKDNDKRFVWIEREIEDEKVEVLKSEIFEAPSEEGKPDVSTGLFWVAEQKRDYPHGTLAAHVIGFSNSDDIGQAGVEKSQESYLKAERLKMVRQRDRQGRVFSEVDLERTPAKDVQITISKEIQHIAERAVERGVKDSGAKSGKAIVMDPKTGEILAMANYPTFDPSDFRELKPGSWRNSAIQDQYAPGSVFKLITYSAAVEEGLVTPESEVDCGSGSITVGGYTFRDSHAVGNVTYTKAMAQSSNVGAIKTGILVGKEKYYRYARDFGFGHRTGIDLPSEGEGVLRTTDKWQSTDLASMSIGYGIDVTALQTVVAFATIANDGVRVEPRILKSVQQNGEIVETVKTESQRVVKSETASALRKMLREVVEDGTAKRARLNGYTSAGKTGTAWKYDQATGGIDSSKYISSFVGFAPANNPAVVIAVVVDEPRGAMRNGGQVAAPVFREIAESILPELRVAPDGVLIDEEPDVIAADDEVPLGAAAAKKDSGAAVAEKKTEEKEVKKKEKAIENDSDKSKKKGKGKDSKKDDKPSPKALDARIRKTGRGVQEISPHIRI